MKCFYHSADLDGHCSGAIVLHKYPECEMIGINYGQEPPWQELIDHPEQTVFMVDFCLQPFDQMERLNSLCRLHWIDHHAKGSIDEAIMRGFLASGGQLIEVGRAGCELTWEHIYPEWSATPPEVVKLIGRYDVWDHSNPRVLPFQYGMRLYEETRPDQTGLWDALFHDDALCDSLVARGEDILLYENAQNTKFCRAYAFETSLIVPVEGVTPEETADASDWRIKDTRYSAICAKYSAICANRGFTNSKLFDSVYDPLKHHIMITFVRLKLPSQRWTVSLYSTRDDVDCGAIAKTFAGGGHKGAAGFQCDELPFAY